MNKNVQKITKYIKKTLKIFCIKDIELLYLVQIELYCICNIVFFYVIIKYAGIPIMIRLVFFSNGLIYFEHLKI